MALLLLLGRSPWRRVADPPAHRTSRRRGLVDMLRDVALALPGLPRPLGELRRITHMLHDEVLSLEHLLAPEVSGRRRRRHVDGVPLVRDVDAVSVGRYRRLTGVDLLVGVNGERGAGDFFFWRFCSSQLSL